MIAEYRRSKNSRTWHWVRECSGWPTYDYEVTRTEPKEGEMCAECREKEEPEEPQ